jgi:3-oxoacyl-(acyl-carrier-protein) synthase
VAGYGVVSPFGNDLAAFDEALCFARSAVRACRFELPGSPVVSIAAARCEFDEGGVPSPSRLPLDRGTAMALYAAESAMHMAGLDTPGSFDTCMPNAPVAELALRWGARGAALAYSCACASAAVAVGEAARAIRAGRLDLAIVGGSEALLSPAIVGAWQAMRVLARHLLGAGGVVEHCCAAHPRPSRRSADGSRASARCRLLARSGPRCGAATAPATPCHQQFICIRRHQCRAHRVALGWLVELSWWRSGP